MYEVKIIMGTLYRMFSTRRGRAFAGIRKKIRLIENDEPVDIEDLDPHDLSEFESDLFNLSESHKSHEKELVRNKERLKQQIVTKKYFKENEARFLTFSEKHLIQTLHESNPEEWTIEKLSESFPALPETIQKILHSKWSPKSVENVIRYDNVVIENWKNFRVGKLPVNPILKEHLMKFKDRKIILADRELLAKQFVPPKPKFEKPKSQLFSGIIQTYLNEKQSESKCLLQEDNPNKKLNITNSNEQYNLLTTNAASDSNLVAVNKHNISASNNKTLVLKSQTNSQNYNVMLHEKRKDVTLTFNEFVKKKLETIYEDSPEEGIALLNLYRKQVSNSQEIQTLEASTISNNVTVTAEKNNTSQIIQKTNGNSVVSKSKNNDSSILSDDDLIETHVKIWNKKIDTELSYASPIKIAKSVYKSGMTYRISDCYYDDDGEFLYRIPGVQS